jgi:putative endonuclease
MTCARLEVHNSGGSPHTSKYKPWRLVTYVGFSDEAKAIAFERYMKTVSGRAFVKKETVPGGFRFMAGPA